MAARRRHANIPWKEARKKIAVPCTDEEYATVKRFAAQEQLTIADFTRRCINNYLLESDDNPPLLTELKEMEP